MTEHVQGTEALALAQLTKARAEVALDSAIIQPMPPLAVHDARFEWLAG